MGQKIVLAALFKAFLRLIVGVARGHSPRSGGRRAGIDKIKLKYKKGKKARAKKIFTVWRFLSWALSRLFSSHSHKIEGIPLQRYRRLHFGRRLQHCRCFRARAFLAFRFFTPVHIENCEKPGMKTKAQAVVDAFKTVSSNNGYRGRWFFDSDYVAMIRLEYGLQSEHLFTHIDLNRSLSRDERFKSANDKTYGNGKGTFRDEFEPKKLPDGSNNMRKKIFCYFVTDEGKSPPKTRNGEPWYVNVKPFRLGSRPRLKISDDDKNELKMLLAHIEEKQSVQFYSRSLFL